MTDPRGIVWIELEDCRPDRSGGGPAGAIVDGFAALPLIIRGITADITPTSRPGP